jgi:hypothetical protein
MIQGFWGGVGMVAGVAAMGMGMYSVTSSKARLIWQF